MELEDLKMLAAASLLSHKDMYAISPEDISVAVTLAEAIWKEVLSRENN